MKKNIFNLIYFCFIFLNVIFFNSVFALTKQIEDKKVYAPTVPENFTQINWVSAPGISSYFKVPKDGGAIDFLTRIYLPNNEINFLFSAGEPKDLNIIQSKPFSDEEIRANAVDINNFHNLSFSRIGSEQSKSIDKGIKFIWDAAFFNMKAGSSDLSMAVKYTINNKTVISSGSRSVPDMARSRKMLIIDNKKETAIIKDFNSEEFISNELGDQAIEAFSPMVVKGDEGTAASRVFVGVSDDGKELVVYCSRLATERDAREALTAAGIKEENQLQADGGGSASCGYNLPGQFFVEPTRTLPLLMGAKTILLKGKVTIDDVNVRDSNSKKGKSIKKLKKNTEVKVYEEKDGWYRIGENEWIMKTYVK